jgi:hypothetical protein
MERKRVDRRRDKHVPKRDDGAAEVPPWRRLIQVVEYIKRG